MNFGKAVIAATLAAHVVVGQDAPFEFPGSKAGCETEGSDVTVSDAQTTSDGNVFMILKYKPTNFLNHGEDFVDFQVLLADGCSYKEDNRGGFTADGSDGIQGGSGSAWTKSVDQDTDCHSLVFETTLNNAVANCGFGIDTTKSDQNQESSVDLTILSSLAKYTSTSEKTVRQEVVKRVYERSTKLDINMGTTVSVTTSDLKVFGFAINEFAVTNQVFDSSIRTTSGTSTVGEDLTTTFVTTVQWPYVLKSSKFTITTDSMQQTLSSATSKPDHVTDQVLEIVDSRDCQENKVCKQVWEVIVQHKEACSSITPLELDNSYNANFLIGCRAEFSGTCVDPGGEPIAGASGVERFQTDFETDGTVQGSNADGEQDTQNQVSWTSDSDNYCTRVLDEIPLEGSIAVYDTDFYNQAQDQFVFGSTAFVKVKVHARAEISKIRIEKITLDHQQGGQAPTGTATNTLYTDKATSNDDFANDIDNGQVTWGIAQQDSLLNVRNDELNNRESGRNDVNDDTDGTNEQLNEAQATFDFVWNEHTSPAGSDDEDDATTTTITVDVRVQFKAAAPTVSPRRMLLQSSPTPGSRQKAVVGVKGGERVSEADEVVGSAPQTNTPRYFAGLVFGIFAAF